jgi:glyceraldehyde-3-phosphate dehydrogenase (NAD(P))
MTTIGVAVNGYGVIGKRVADAVQAMPDMELVGVADVATDWRVRTAIGHDIPVFAATQQAEAAMRAAEVPLAGRPEGARVGRRPDRPIRTTPKDHGRPKTFPHTRQ